MLAEQISYNDALSITKKGNKHLELKWMLWSNQQYHQQVRAALNRPPEIFQVYYWQKMKRNELQETANAILYVNYIERTLQERKKKVTQIVGSLWQASLVFDGTPCRAELDRNFLTRSGI